MICHNYIITNRTNDVQQVCGSFRPLCNNLPGGFRLSGTTNRALGISLSISHMESRIYCPMRLVMGEYRESCLEYCCFEYSVFSAWSAAAWSTAAWRRVCSLYVCSFQSLNAVAGNCMQPHAVQIAKAPSSHYIRVVKLSAKSSQQESAGTGK